MQIGSLAMWLNILMDSCKKKKKKYWKIRDEINIFLSIFRIKKMWISVQRSLDLEKKIQFPHVDILILCCRDYYYYSRIFIKAYILVDFIQVDSNALHCGGDIVRFDLCGRPEINHRRHRSVKPLHLIAQLCLV